MLNKLTSVDRVLSKLERDYDLAPYEDDVIEWIGEALEAIGTPAQLQEDVAYIEVINHQVSIPNGTHSIIQIAENRCWDDSSKGICPSDVLPIIPSTEQKPYQPVLIDCNGQPITDYEVAYYRPYFDAVYSYGAWITSNQYQTCWQPVRLAEHSFFNDLVYRTDDEMTNANTLYRKANSENEYRIINGQTIRFGFQTGQVAISLLRQSVDSETGYPLIVDRREVLEAITNYINYKIQSKQFFLGREGAGQRMEKAESNWHWYCQQAANALRELTVDDYQNLFDQFNNLIRPTNRYFSFFGKLAQVEDRSFLDQRVKFRGYYTQYK